jgi:hypothetical protein
MIGIKEFIRFQLLNERPIDSILNDNLVIELV